MPDIVLSNEVARLIPDYVELGNKLAEAAVELEKTQSQNKAGRQKVASEAAELAKFMADTKNIDEFQIKKAEEMICTHEGAVNLLRTSVQKLAEAQTELRKQQTKVGSAVPDNYGEGTGGDAAYDSLNDPFVGRKTTQKKASDLALLKALGLPIS